MPSGHPPTPNSIIVGNCIACNGLVRVSATANANADVRCPHCQQTFPLVRLLESSVPEVEVVVPQVATVKKQELYIDKTAGTAKDASGKFVVPSQLAKGARRRKSSRSSRSRSRSSSRGSESERSSSRSSESERSSRHRSDSESRPDAPAPSYRDESRTQSQTAEHTDNTTHDTSPPHNNSRSESIDHQQEPLVRSPDNSEQSLSSHRSTRHRDARAAEALRSQANPAVDFLKIIAGACLALPIAYLIVMWVFTKDPLGIGDGLGAKLPFLVPTALRATDSDADDATPKAEPSFLDFAGDEDQEADDSSDVGFESLNIGGEALKGLDF